MKAQSFYARPHPRWQVGDDGQPITRNGKLVAELDANGQAVIACYTLACGQGECTTKIDSAPVMVWPKFKRKKDAEAFIADHDYKRRPFGWEPPRQPWSRTIKIAKAEGRA